MKQCRFEERRSLPDTLTELRSAALDYGHRARYLGFRPAQLVTALKHLLIRHGAPELALQVFEEPTPGAPMTTTRYGRLLAWCLDGYFADSKAREYA